MKIAQIAPMYESVPPRLYGGTERVVAHLCNALVSQGHDVTLFASADARTRARLVPMRQQALRLDPAPLKSDLASHMVLLQEVRRQADDFDVLHFHIDLLHFPFFADMAQRTLTTLHGRLDLKDLPEAYALWTQFPLASISRHQRDPLPFACWLGLPGLESRCDTFPAEDNLAIGGTWFLEMRGTAYRRTARRPIGPSRRQRDTSMGWGFRNQ